MAESPPPKELSTANGGPSISEAAPKKINLSQKMFEKTALKPYDENKDQEEWPLLELTNATVTRKNKKHRDGLEDLLDVEERGPFEVRGTLSKIPDNLKNIIRTSPAEKMYNTLFCLKSVYTYSIEQFKDGSIKIWALGECAWYSVRPSEEYKSVFNIMLEKARMWFFLQDKYAKLGCVGKKVRGKVEQLYKSYAEVQSSTCPDMHAAARLFDTHHGYLLAKMCSQADVEKWKRTPLFCHYVVKYPGEFARIQESTAVKEVLGSSSSASVNRPRRKTVSYRMFENLERYVNDHKLQPVDVTKDRIAQFLYESYVFDSHERAVRNIDARAQEMIGLMDMPPTPFNWTSTPAYKELEAVIKSTSGVVARKERLVERNLEGADDSGDEEMGEATNVWSPTSAGTSTNASITTTDSDSDPEELLHKRLSAEGTSSLRPSFTPASSSLPKSMDDDASSKSPSRKHASDKLASPSAGTSNLAQRFARCRPPLSFHRAPVVGPNGPGGHWECEIDGCKHSILDAGDKKAIDLIEKHYAEHAKVMERAMEAIEEEVPPPKSRQEIE